jgi:hypothetical protein
LRNGYEISENLKGKDHLKDLSADGDSIKMDLQIVSGNPDWIHVAQDSDKRVAVVSMVKNLRVSKTRGICLLAERLLASQ